LSKAGGKNALSSVPGGKYLSDKFRVLQAKSDTKFRGRKAGELEKVYVYGGEGRGTATATGHKFDVGIKNVFDLLRSSHIN